MALGVLLNERNLVFSLIGGCFLALISIFFYLFRKPPFPKNAPALDSEAFPIVGSLRFFTQRWDFYQRATARSHSGNFSFYAGQWPVVGLSGDNGRKIFFETKGLSLGEGYAALLSGAPDVPESKNPFAESNKEERGFAGFFSKRLITMLKGNRLAQGLPQLLQDARGMLDELAADPQNITDPFDSIYRMVFKFTMRTLACNEVADDPILLRKVLSFYEAVEESATPISIMFPWIPTIAKVKRFYFGAKLYAIFKNVVDTREKENRRENDTLQYLVDEGDSITDIITFVMGALFAGQLNSGVNAAWVLVYLAHKPYWLEQMREEVEMIADRYSHDKSAPLKERLMNVPCDAWEGEFPIADACLKDSMRLQISGTAYRKNVSGVDIPLDKAGKEVIPRDAYVTYAIGDAHYDPEIFENPDEWDPSRYMPGREEDKKKAYSWVGWGVGRHPCLGMRFAKLEMNIILAFFLAYFENIQLCDENGNETSKLPAVNRNEHTARRPEEHVHLRYKVRKG